jgi:hypothetical protein
MAASAGNHALALSWHGAQLGIPVSVFMPVVAPLAKVDKCRKFGANVIITGQHIGEAKVDPPSLPLSVPPSLRPCLLFFPAIVSASSSPSK